MDSVALSDIQANQLDTLRREHDTQLRAYAEEAKRHSIERSAETARRLDAIVQGQRAAWGSTPDDLFGPGSELLLSVDFIRSWPTPSNLKEWHQEPGLNWAKYAVNIGPNDAAQPDEKVSFYTFWQNPRKKTVLADFLVRLTSNGHCSCTAQSGGLPGGFFFESVSRLEVGAQLTLWGLWSDPAPLFVVDRVPLLSISASGRFFSGHEQSSISEAPAVKTTSFPVPAEAFVLIEASVTLQYTLIHGAGVEADFASADLGVGCPYAVVTLPLETNLNG